MVTLLVAGGIAFGVQVRRTFSNPTPALTLAILS